MLGADFATTPFVWPDDRAYHAGFEAGAASEQAARIAAGLWATGAPLEAPGHRQSCAIGGQARGVLALWVAYHDLPTDAAVGLVRAQQFEPVEFGAVDPAFAEGAAWPESVDVWAPVVWSGPDLEAARRLLRLPRAQTRDALWREWARFIEPATTTNQLLASLGIEPVGPPTVAPPGSKACQ